MSNLRAQTILFADEFNNCELSSEWQVTNTGNPDAAWYVGIPDNENSDGSTIDGTCMLIMDDDGTGEGTEPWTLRLVSPAFDASAWTTVQLSVDVHFRNYNGTASLSILVFDGSEFQTLQLYQGDLGHTGEQFSAFITYTADLSFFANPNMSIAIDYDDGGDWAWWAGIDNLQVIGEGSATNIIVENFDDCNLPEGWLNQIIGGEDDWQFGFVENENAGENTSMNGSCFAFFDDDILTEDAIPSRVLLLSPAFDGLAYANYYLNLDLIFRRYEDLEHLAIGVYDEESGQIQWVESHFEDLGGPGFNAFVPRWIDLSAYRKPAMRLAFQYDDGGGWGWWVGLDNVKVSGEGLGNDICANAIDLIIDEACTIGTNQNTLFTGPPANCSNQNEGSLWYRFYSENEQLIQIITNASYNDALTLFEGNCDVLDQKACTNYDEFGFTGEKLIFEANAQTYYYLRINGYKGAFGLPRGTHCVQIISLEELPATPGNDQCFNAEQIIIGSPCLTGNNRNANFDGPMPSRNSKSKADIWYRFTTNTNTPLEILSHADFADVITVYQDACDNLEEVACGDLGQGLVLESPMANTEYFIQVSGYFATLEGSLCIEAREIMPELATNIDCSNAVALTIDADCLEFSNTGAPFTGPEASCTIFQAASLWFTFEAPASGKTYIQTEASYVHAAAIFAGDCEALQEVACFDNPNYCGNHAIIEGLTPGETYWLRLNSMSDFTGVLETGDICLQILDGASVPLAPPLTISGYFECYGNGQAQLLYEVFGGTGPYEIQGNTQGEILDNGTNYVVLATDEFGCQTSIAGTVDCAVQCQMSAAITVLEGNDCPNDYMGALSVDVTGEGLNYAYLWQDGSTSASLNNIPSGLYTVTITDLETGCNAIATATVPGPSPFYFEILSINDPINDTIGGSIQIAFSGGEPPYSFEWLRNGNLVSTNQNPANLLPGFYDILITDAAGCTFSYNGIELQATTATLSSQNWTFFSLYPNPASGRTYLEWQAHNADLLDISVLNASGQLIKRYSLSDKNNNPYPLDLEQIPGGIYLIRLQTDKGSHTKKLVLVK